MKKIITPVLLLSLMLSTISPVQNVESATKLSLSHTKCSMEVGESKKVKATKVVTWKTSNKKIVKIKKLSSKKAKITAKKAGSCIVTATAGKKKATIHVNVKKDGTTIEKTKTTVKPDITATTVPTQTPTSVVQITNSPVPNGTVKTSPSATPTISASTEPTRTPAEATEIPNKPTMGSDENAEKATTKPSENTETATTKPTENPIEATAEPTLAPTEAVSARPTIIPTENPIEVTTEPTLAPTEAVSARPTTVPTGNPIEATTEPTLTPTGVVPARPTTVPAENPIEVTTGSNITATPIEPTIAPIIPPVVVSQSGIVMTLKGYEKGKITYIIDNQSGKEWQYNYGYSMEKNIDGEWVKMEADRYPAMPDVIFSLKDGDVIEKTSDIATCFDLEAGTYRYTKSFFSKDCKCIAEVALLFDVKNNITSYERISMILDSYKNGKITYTIENAGAEWIYDYGYSIEKKVDGEWVTMKTDRPVPIPDVELELSKESKVNETVDLVREYDLEAGSYRFVKTFKVKSDLELFDYTTTLTLPFQVEKTIMNFSEVRATVEGFENGYLIYTIENLTDKNVGYNPAYYAVKREVNGEWHFANNAFGTGVMPDVIETVEPGEKKCEKTYIGEWEDLKSGKYMLSLYFYTDGIEFELPFEIKKPTVTHSDICMVLDNYADGKVTFTIKNESEQVIGYSYDDYILQQKINGQWTDVESVRGFEMRKLWFSLVSGESDTQTVNLALGYDLQPGKYRFVKKIGQEEFALPFQVTEENTNFNPVIVSQAGVRVLLISYEDSKISYVIDNQSGKEIRYSYEGIAIGEKVNGEWALAKLHVERSGNTDGSICEGVARENIVQLDAPAGSYHYLITFAVENGTESDRFTLALPFAVSK